MSLVQKDASGAEVEFAARASELLFTKDDLVEVIVTPDDGLDLGVGLSANLEVSNSAPTVASVTVTPLSGNETTVFSAVPAVTPNFCSP